MANKILTKSSFMPEYLSNYLSSLSVPNIIDRVFLESVGRDILAEKQADIEAGNINLSPRMMKRIPSKMPFDEVALVLMYLFTFKNIRVSERSTDYLLGVYVTTGEKEGIYITSRKDLYRLIDPLVPYYKNKEIDDILDKIERMVPTVTQTNDSSLFITNNGVFDQNKKQLLPFSPEYVYLTKIPVNYVEKPNNPVLIADDGYKWDVETWISDLAVDAETATLIWQVIADTLQPGRSRGRSIWFYSESGNNGKGTLGQLIKNILGVGNYSALAVTDFKHEFLKESLVGVAANISDENDVDVYIDSIRDYKASITGDDININRKYEKPIRLQFRGTNIQMLNGLPKTKDKSDSFYRRLIMVPFLKSFTNNGERKYIKDIYIKNKEVLEYVLWKVLNLEFDEFTIPQRSEALLAEYKEMNNPVMQFWNELSSEFVWNLLPTQFLYDLFVSWSHRNNPTGKPMSKRSFTDTLAIILDSDKNWESKLGQNDKVKCGSKLDNTEYLILEYDLDKWMNKTYTGSNITKRLDFKKAATYRGVVRK